MTETIGIDISARDLTAQAMAAVARNTDSMRQSMAEVAKGNSVVAASWAQVTGGITQAKEIAEQARAAFALVVGNEIIQGLKEYNTRVSEQTGALKDQADGLNLTTDQLQAYIAAFSKAGYTNEQARATLAKFNGTVGEALQGSKASIDALDKLNVKILDNSGKVRDQNAILAESATKLLAMNDGQTKVALSNALFGRSGGQLTPVLREIAGGVDDLIDKAKDLGTVATPAVIDQFERLNIKSNTLKLQIDTLYGSIAAPIGTAAMDKVNDKFATFSTRVKEAIKDFGTFRGISLALVGAPIFGLPITEAEAADKQVQKLTASVTTLQARLDSVGNNPTQAAMLPMLQRQLTEAQGRLAAAQMTADEAHRSSGAAILFPTVEVKADKPGASNPPATGGGSGDKRDRIQEAINRLTKEEAAAQVALDAMIAGAAAGLPLKDVEQAAEIQKKIADQEAALGKYNPKDPRIAQLEALVSGNVKLNASFDQRKAAEKDALEVEKQFGDGSAQLAVTVAQLNLDYATGRLTLDAYNAKMKQATETADDQARALRGAKGGADGFFAGMQQGAADQAKANTSFKLGTQAYNDTFAILKTTVNDWATTGVLDINKFGQAMLGMIANVGMALAQSELLKLLQGGGGAAGGAGGAGGGLFSWIGGLFSGGGSGTAAAAGDLGFGSAPIVFAAGGGDIPGNRPSIVGEAGPEIFVPATHGAVFNQQQLAGMGGGGGDVNIVQHMTFGSDVDQSTLRSWGNRWKDETKAEILAARRSGGVWRSTFSP